MHIPVDSSLYRRLLAVFAIFFNTLVIYASWNPFIHHYPKDMPQGSMQTWQIVSADDNWHFFATKKGLLQFAGDQWQLYSPAGKPNVRSVMVSADRKIYCGAINEFGYFYPGANGELEYTSMSDTLTATEQYFGNVWGIYEADKIIYFQADGSVIKLVDGKCRLIRAEFKIDCSNLIRGTLYLGTSEGLKVMVGDHFFPLPGCDELAGKKIRSIQPYGQHLLIATARDAIYEWDGNTLQPFVTGEEALLKHHQIFSMVVSDEYVAVGTVTKGVILYERNTSCVRYANENNGLKNNTVLSLSFDLHGNLWAGMDAGIDYINLTSPYTSLYVFPNSYGTGYGITLYRNDLYFATNRGVFRTSWHSGKHHGVLSPYSYPELVGQGWDLQEFSGDLFCLHDRGLFQIDGDRVTRIGEISGVWGARTLPNLENCFWVGTYEGIFCIQKENGRWKVAYRVEGFYESCYNFELESPSVFWVHCDGRGVFRVETDPTNRMISQRIFTSVDGFPADKEIYVNSLYGKILFTTPGGIYYYDRSADRMVCDTRLTNLLDGDNGYHRISLYNGELYALQENQVIFVTSQSGNKGDLKTVFPLDYPGKCSVRMFEKLVPLTDNHFVLIDESGFNLLNRKKHRKATHRPDFYIHKVYLSYPKDSLIFSGNYLNRTLCPEIPYQFNSLRFEYGSHQHAANTQLRYRYRLYGREDWSELSEGTVKEYSNLHEGSYRFQVEAIDADNITNRQEFYFVIQAPWFRTKLAYVMYLLLAGAMLWSIFLFVRHRVRLHNREVVTRKDDEILQLQREQLEYQLKQKSQEMANLLMNFVRKNETLAEIKQDLLSVMNDVKGDDSLRTRRLLMTVNNKIDSNMQSDELLRRFEEQFDLVHNQFMSKLSEKHPTLTMNEKKMCAYVRMDLSSKEIAPLMNLSYRGVETLRYRLRKKLNISREDNLAEYLHTIGLS